MFLYNNSIQSYQNFKPSFIYFSNAGLYTIFMKSAAKRAPTIGPRVNIQMNSNLDHLSSLHDSKNSKLILIIYEKNQPKSYSWIEDALTLVSKGSSECKEGSNDNTMF